MATSPEKLNQEIDELEREVQRLGASARDAEAALSALDERRAEAAGRLQLARRAAADYEARLAERRAALREARREAAVVAFREAVRHRDAMGARLAERLSIVVAELEELDRLREEARSAHAEMLELADGRGPTDVPVEPPELQERWEELAALVRRELDEQLEDELIEAAARSPMGTAIGDLPRHLQEAAKRRRQQLLRAVAR